MSLPNHEEHQQNAPECCAEITAAFAKYYAFLTAQNIAVRNALIALLTTSTISQAEYDVRTRVYSDVSDEISKVFGQTIQVLACDKKINGCCDVTIPAIEIIAEQYQTQLAALIVTASPVDYFTNPATAAAALKAAHDITRDFQEAAKSFLAALTCRKPCKKENPCERERECEQERERSCEREKWYEVVPVAVHKKEAHKERRHHKAGKHSREW